MNRLQLVQRLRQEFGIDSAGPSTTIGATGEAKRLVDSIDAAWIEIQNLTTWGWRWEIATLMIAAGASAVGTVTPPKLWLLDTMRRADGGDLEYMPWSEFRERFRVISGIVPSCWTVQPDRSVMVNAIAPVGGLVLTGERYKQASTFAADADIPAMPEDKHLAIVWLALQKMAGHDEAAAMYTHAEREYRKLMLPEFAESTPEIELGGALC